MIPVKICGLTRERDVEDAVAAGAGAVGVVLWPDSPRGVTARRAGELMRLVPEGVARVGVFVNASAAEIRAAVEEAALDVAQLHGEERREVVEAVAARCRVLKAVSDAAGLAEASTWPVEESRVGWLVDAHDPARRGGTGTRADWRQAAELARRRRIVLAGGLTAGNVHEAVMTVRPAALDVSSGVERAPGVKDRELMKELLAVTRRLGTQATAIEPRDEAAAGFLDAVFAVQEGRSRHS